MSKKNSPQISVVMTVWNAEKFLTDSVESILNQTYNDFEFIIVDDRSSDKSWDIINAYSRKDSRIKVFRNRKHSGIPYTVYHGIRKSKGKFIAFMDADDISTPYRLKKQLNYLVNHAETIAVGGQCLLMNTDGQLIGNRVYPEKHEDIYRYFYTFNAFHHPTLMIAKNRLPKKFQYYGSDPDITEELNLNFKLLRLGKLANLNCEVLISRIRYDSLHRFNIKRTFLLTLYARIKAVFKYGYKPNLFDVIITLAQTFVVLVLPKRLALFIYARVRNMSIEKEKSPGKTPSTMPSTDYAY